MTKNIFLLHFLLLFSIAIYSDDNIDQLFSRYPVIITADTITPRSDAEKTTVWQRSDMYEAFSINQVAIKDGKLLIKNNTVEFLSPEKSRDKLTDYYGRIQKLPRIIYRYDFEIDAEGFYLLAIDLEAGTYAYVDQELLVANSTRLLCKRGSGQSTVNLKKGRHTLFLLTAPGASGRFRFVPFAKLESIKAEFNKKVSLSNPEDIAWSKNILLPTLANIRNGIYSILNFEIARLHKANPFTANAESSAYLKTIIPDGFHEGYFVEEYIFTNMPDIYFYLTKKGDGGSAVYDGFLLNNNEPRVNFIRQLVFNGQREKGDLYFNKAEETINALSNFSAKDKFISQLYSTRFMALFHIGRIRETLELQKITEEKCKTLPISDYKNRKPDQEDLVTLTQSFDETAAYQMQEALTSYEEKPDQLQALYKTFTGLQNNLVKRNDGAVSFQYIFEFYKNQNEKLKKDFEKLCLEKVQPLIEKAKETRNFNLMEEIIGIYENILPIPELHLLLMDEYYKSGDYLKALSHAKILFDKHPNYKNKVITKLAILEDLSDIPYEDRRKLPNELLKTPIKVKGQNTSLGDLISLRGVSSAKTPGQLLSTIPIEIPHVQYWNHPQFDVYQPVEPLFTQNNIIINGGSYLLNYSIPKKEVNWAYRSLGEYKKESENGPHQKRFYTAHSGDRLFMITNCNNSSQKTIKSFDLSGNVLWDMTEQNNTFVEEPLCTPMPARGKLFGFSYSNRETINTISFCVYDVNSGAQKSRIPISYIPTGTRDESCKGVGLSWNSFTHDQHFYEDGDFVYAFSGSGIILKVDSNSGNILWEKGFAKSNYANEYRYWDVYGSAPSGFIKTFGNVLLTYMPDIQIFTALDKTSGDIVWKTNCHVPRYLHGRNKSDFVYYSSAFVGQEPIVYKINPQTGATIWQISTNGLPITGEGDLFGDKLWIPSEKAILEIDINKGQITKVYNLDVQPLKIRSSIESSVLFTASAAYIFKNNGEWDAKSIKPVEPMLKTSKVIEPDLPSQPTLSFEDINLEVTLKIPETIYTSPDRWKKTQLFKTSKNFHFILRCKEYLTMFREGYHLKSGLYVPPEIIWSAQYPCFDIAGDILYVSEPGKITARNLFTREKLWDYEYDHFIPPIRNSYNKASPVIAVSDKYICYQTTNQTLRILDVKTKNLILEFNSPTINKIRMHENYVVTSLGSGVIRCFDISQNGKEIWNTNYDHYGDLFIENGLLVIVKTNSSTICFYDLKTGALKVQASSTFGGEYYIMNRFKLDDKFLFAYKRLYDPITGKPIEKYGAGNIVNGGGYIGFFKRYGQEGNYIDADGKEYAFRTKGGFSDDNYVFSASRKGNRIAIFSFYFIEVFEISGDKLVSIDYSTLTTGRYGNHADQFNLDLFILDDSLLEIRRDHMYFYRNFDSELNFETIQSFRVDNKRKFHWPYSELYPEVEVGEKNWISYFGEKPKQKMYYQAFGDENYAYLRFRLTPNTKKDFNTTLFISSDGIQEKISFIWDTENWKNAQTSYFISDNTETWKEVDIKGNIVLYFKIKLAGAYSKSASDTLPVFNIELRQMTGNQNDGMYRIGGAYQGIINQIPWLNYTNDEAQSLRNFQERSAQYTKNKNFYPQGYDLAVWLKDRRKLKGIEDNIKTLNQMLSDNAKFYCSVNILSSLLLEEIQQLDLANPNLDEFADDYPAKIQGIISRLNTDALAKGMNKEWVDFALSIWSFEIFPYKFSYMYSRDYYSKPYYSVYIKSTKQNAKFYFSKNNLICRSINHPFIEWVVPGLIPNFPNNFELNQVNFTGFGAQKTGLGKMMFYSPAGAKEFCQRNGVPVDSKTKIVQEEGGPVLPSKESGYYYKNKKYTISIIEYERLNVQIAIPTPVIKMPAIIKDTGQTAESILTALENLPTDNNNGLMLVQNYLSLSGKSGDSELIKVYAKWLESLRDNSTSSQNALVSILETQRSRKDVFEFIESVIKESKITPIAPRAFYISRRNLFNNKEFRSVLGPCLKELVNRPENNFDALAEYKTTDTVHKFGDSWEAKKGGVIYLASKLKYEGNEKVYLFLKAVNNYATVHTTATFSVWLNEKSIVQNVTFLSFDNDTFYHKLNLSKGENILLIRVNGIDNYEWGWNYFMTLGNNYAAPIEGLSVLPAHKP